MINFGPSVLRAVVVVIVWYSDLQLPVQSVPITTNVVTLNPIHGMVYSTTFCDKVCLSLETGLWFSPHTMVSSTNKIDCHDITQILLKVALNTIYQTKTLQTLWTSFIKSILYHTICYGISGNLCWFLWRWQHTLNFEFPHLNYPYQNCFYYCFNKKL